MEGFGECFDPFAESVKEEADVVPIPVEKLNDPARRLVIELRAILTSFRFPLSPGRITVEYVKLNGELPNVKRYGYNSLHEFLRCRSDAFNVEGEFPNCRFSPTYDEASARIRSLVLDQKTQCHHGDRRPPFLKELSKCSVNNDVARPGISSLDQFDQKPHSLKPQTTVVEPITPREVTLFGCKISQLILARNLLKAGNKETARRVLAKLFNEFCEEHWDKNESPSVLYEGLEVLHAIHKESFANADEED